MSFHCFNDIRGSELVTRRSEVVTRGFQLVLLSFQLVTRNSCFTISPFVSVNNVKRNKEDERRNKKSWNSCGTYCINIWYKQKKYERNGIETMVDSDGIL